MLRRLPALLAAVLFGASLGFGLGAAADTLVIDGIERQSGPKRGSSMASVEAQFGEPVTRRGPVGDPPISSWEYPGFVVYFEHNLVIHSVHKRG